MDWHEVCMNAVNQDWVVACFEKGGHLLRSALLPAPYVCAPFQGQNIQHFYSEEHK